LKQVFEEQMKTGVDGLSGSRKQRGMLGFSVGSSRQDRQMRSMLFTNTIKLASSIDITFTKSDVPLPEAL